MTRKADSGVHIIEIRTKGNYSHRVELVSNQHTFLLSEQWIDDMCSDGSQNY